MVCSRSSLVFLTNTKSLILQITSVLIAQNACILHILNKEDYKYIPEQQWMHLFLLVCKENKLHRTLRED